MHFEQSPSSHVPSHQELLGRALYYKNLLHDKTDAELDEQIKAHRKLVASGIEVKKQEEMIAEIESLLEERKIKQEPTIH